MHRASPTLRATITINRLRPATRIPVRPWHTGFWQYGTGSHWLSRPLASQARASPPSGSIAAAQEHARAPPECFSRLARRGLTFRSADVQACCLPSCFCFIARTAPQRTATSSLTPSRTHAHYRCCSPLSLVPLPAFQAVHQLRHPFPLASAFSPTAIWDLKCLPAFLRSLELLLHPYHRQNFFAVHSLASLDSTTHQTDTWSVGPFTARLLPDDTLFYSAHHLMLID